jgi:hypothetical protein
MHSKEDEEPKLTPENSDAGIDAWRKDFLNDGGSSTAYLNGVEDGWHDAVEALRSLNLHDAADQLEAYRQRAIDRA